MINFLLGMFTMIIVSVVITCIICYINIKFKKQIIKTANAFQHEEFTEHNLLENILGAISKYHNVDILVVEELYYKLKYFDVVLILLDRAKKENKEPLKLAETWIKNIETQLIREIQTDKTTWN